MKYLINAYHCSVGGGKQIGLSFIKFILENENLEAFFFIVNPTIYRELNPENVFQKRFIVVNEGSLGSLKRFREIERELKPKCVFTIFGPTLWRPKATHVVGFAKPQIIYEKEYLESGALTLSQRVKFKLKYSTQKYLFKLNADFFIVESNDVKEKLTKIMALSAGKVFYVSNTYHQIFNEYVDRHGQFPDYPAEPFNLFCLGNNYPHKNFRIIRSMIPFVIANNVNVRFLVTLSDADYQSMFAGYDQFVVNLGILTLEDCIEAYKRSHALFLPTLLECFSASWPESMAMGIPILTSDRSFAKGICDDAALYFDPLNPKDIVQKIEQLVANRNLFNDLIDKGKQRLKHFPSADDRSKKYLQIINEVTR